MIKTDERAAHVWAFRLDGDSTIGILSADERARAKRFRDPRDARRFSNGRSMLRTILALYAGTAPQQLRFEYGAAGKPRLNMAGGRPLDFNLSHCGERAMLAVASSPVGLDLAEHDASYATCGVVSCAFDAREAFAWESLPLASRSRGFFKGWTSREAVAKAEGTGLPATVPFTVCVDPERPPAILSGAATWRLHAVELSPDVSAVLCAPRTLETIDVIDWP